MLSVLSAKDFNSGLIEACTGKIPAEMEEL